MKIKVVIPLLLSATAALAAAETQFHAPATERAQQTQQLLSSAARAVKAGGQQVSDLWVFPTAARDTVFAQYVGNSGQQHLEVLQLQGSRIVSRRDLTNATN